MTDRFSVLLNALRRANLRQDVVVDVVQQQPAVVEHVALFHDRFEEKSVGQAVQQSAGEFAQSTWKTHVSACKDFLVFCAARKVHSLTTGPSIVHLFLLFTLVPVVNAVRDRWRNFPEETLLEIQVRTILVCALYLIKYSI